MMRRVLLLAAFLPLALFGQIQLFLFDGTNETPVSGSGLDVGRPAVGDTLPTRFRIRNAGTASVPIASIKLAGSGFTLSATPTLPYILAPGAAVDFSTAFSATVPASYSANLTINTLTVVLRATAIPAAQVAGVFLDGAATPLAAGATIDFGSVPAGSSGSHALTVDNSGGANAVSLSLSGSSFHVAALPAQVGPGAKASFQISFQPPSGQAFQGTLKVDQRAFTLKGQGTVPPTPSATIVVNNGAAVASSQQVEISIPLGSPALAISTGTLTLQFQPAGGARDDPFIGFNTAPSRSATVSISLGDTLARIRGNPSIVLQTGTTAGSIVLTLQLGASGSQVTIPIVPAAISIDTAAGLVSTGELTISLAGFDNTHSASQVAFTFYDTNGKKVSPGTITVDASSMFQTYFQQGAYGGAFSLQASFPVTGNVTLISTAQVGLTNSAGVTQTQRIPFP